jgi:hypothetical protein
LKRLKSMVCNSAELQLFPIYCFCFSKMLKILRFYSCFCLSDDFLVAKGDLKVEQTRMQMARGFPIYFLFLGSRNACFFLNSFSWKTQKHTGFIRFSAIRGGTFFDSFF